MAYNEKLAERVREVLAGKNGYMERKMFGGLCCMMFGNMCIGIVGDDLMVRVGPEAYETILKKKYVRPMDFTGRPLKGMVYVSAPGYKSADQLQGWIDQALSFVKTLPRK